MSRSILIQEKEALSVEQLIKKLGNWVHAVREEEITLQFKEKWIWMFIESPKECLYDVVFSSRFEKTEIEEFAKELKSKISYKLMENASYATIPEDFLNVFGSLVVESREVGRNLISTFMSDEVKNPSKDKIEIIDFIQSLTPKKLTILKKLVKLSNESALFTLLNTLEKGSSDYSFKLSIEKEGKELHILTNEKSSDLSNEFWRWIKETDEN